MKKEFYTQNLIVNTVKTILHQHSPQEVKIQTSRKSVPVRRERKPENHKKHITRDGKSQ